jgi:hypothetical protein
MFGKQLSGTFRTLDVGITCDANRICLCICEKGGEKRRFWGSPGRFNLSLTPLAPSIRGLSLPRRPSLTFWTSISPIPLFLKRPILARTKESFRMSSAKDPEVHGGLCLMCEGFRLDTKPPPEWTGFLGYPLYANRQLLEQSALQHACPLCRMILDCLPEDTDSDIRLTYGYGTMFDYLYPPFDSQGKALNYDVVRPDASHEVRVWCKFRQVGLLRLEPVQGLSNSPLSIRAS